jgi:hypothetical protein
LLGAPAFAKTGRGGPARLALFGLTPRGIDVSLMAHRVASQAANDLDGIWHYVATESGSIAFANHLIDSTTDRFFFFWPAIQKMGAPTSLLDSFRSIRQLRTPRPEQITDD